MSVTVPRKTYPLLKVTVPLAILLALAGLVLFFSGSDPTLFVAALVVAAILVFGSLFYRRTKLLEMRLPSDELGDRSRTELEGLLTTLDEQKARGELSEERHRKARAKIEAQLKAKGKR